MKHFFLGVLPVLCSCAVVFAQGGATGAINGTIEDSSAAAVPGADVRIIDQVSGNQLRTLVTDDHGTFTALLLPVGTYTVVVRAKGFAEQRGTNVEVRVTETTRMNGDASSRHRDAIHRSAFGCLRRRNHYASDRRIDRVADDRGSAVADAKRGAATYAVRGCFNRFDRGGAIGARRHSHEREWAARGLQQCADRRDQRQRLQRG